MKIGLIAGSGQFPILFSKRAMSKGFEVYAVAHHDETDFGLEDYVQAIEWIHLGQIKRIIKFFKENHIHQAVLLGAIAKTRMFRDVRLDSKAFSLVASMQHTHDDGLLRGFAKLLEKEGIIIRASTFLLPELLAQEGCWTKRKPTRFEMTDIKLGWDLAKEVGRLDIGQCLVVGGGSVLAVEAIEGTDATIKRGGKLSRGSAVVVKVCKPNQDKRFDIPAVGAQTIKTMYEVGLRVLAIEAGKAVVFDREEMIELANKFDMAIVALEK